MQGIDTGIRLTNRKGGKRKRLAISHRHNLNLPGERILLFRLKIDHFRFIRLKLYRQVIVNCIIVTAQEIHLQRVVRRQLREHKVSRRIRAHEHVHATHTNPDKFTIFRHAGQAAKCGRRFKTYIAQGRIARVKSSVGRTAIHNRQAVLAFRSLEREVTEGIRVEVRVHNFISSTIGRRSVIDTPDRHTCIRRHSAIAQVGNAVRRFAAGASCDLIRAAPKHKS